MPAARPTLALPRAKAAAALSMDVETFSDLVACGSLPRPRLFHGRRGTVELWPVSKLEAVLNADNAEDDEFEP